MKVVFKVCCAPETETQNATQTSLDIAPRNNVTVRISMNTYIYELKMCTALVRLNFIWKLEMDFRFSFRGT